MEVIALTQVRQPEAMQTAEKRRHWVGGKKFNGGSFRNASRWAVHFVLLSPTILQKASAIKNTLSVMMANQAPGEDGTSSSADLVRAQPRGPEAGEEASAGEDRCPDASYTGGADAMQAKSACGTLRSVLSRTHSDEYCSSSSSKSVVGLQSSPRLLSSLLPYHTPDVECPSPNRLLLFLGPYMSSSQSAHIDTHPLSIISHFPSFQDLLFSQLSYNFIYHWNMNQCMTSFIKRCYQHHPHLQSQVR